jgi:hypothetical protein
MKTQWHFRPLVPGETTRDPIVGEFFATEAINNAGEALVREGIQNSLDAAIEEPLHVRLFLATGQHGLSAKQAAPWFEGAWKHMGASGNGLREAPTRTERCSFLVFEDFGTRGLQGDVAQPFDEPDTKNHFFYFFRGEGRTGKGEQDRGRWGVGKHVFPRSSRISSFFGLTIRADDKGRFLMGQTKLKSHRVGGTHFSPDGYFGEQRTDKLVIPLTDKKALDQFSVDFSLKRKNEPGLSLVVPFIDADFSIEDLKEAVVCGYFFPILTGALVVTAETPDGAVVIDAESLVDVALSLGGEISQKMLPLIDLAEWAAFRPDQDFFKLNPCNPDRPEWADDLIPSELLPTIQSKLAKGERIAIRVSLTIREKGKPAKPSYFEIFLWKDGYESGRPVFVREGIIISDVRAPRARGVRSLVVIADKAIATLLGDSENPAHTQWQKDSSNFRGKYTNGSAYLDFVTHIVSNVIRCVNQQDEQADPDLLKEIFSLPKPTCDEAPPEKSKPRKLKKPEEPKEPIVIPPIIETKKRRFKLNQVAGGFSVTRGPDGAEIPKRLRIEVAYDRRQGNPLKKYDHADFRLEKKPIRLEPAPMGLKIVEQKGNCLVAEVVNINFHLTVVGFDERRDLIIDVKAEDENNDTQT